MNYIFIIDILISIRTSYYENLTIITDTKMLIKVIFKKLSFYNKLFLKT